MRFCRLSLRREDVLGIGRLVVYLFRRYITFCKECRYCITCTLCARNVSFRISLRWLIHIINSVDKTKLYFILTMEEAFKPGAKPIKTAMVTLCDQRACSTVITFVSTAISSDTAIRISQGRTITLKKQKICFHFNP